MITKKWSSIYSQKMIDAILLLDPRDRHDPVYLKQYLLELGIDMDKEYIGKDYQGPLSLVDHSQTQPGDAVHLSDKGFTSHLMD